MSNAKADKVVSKQAQSACLEVAKEVIAKAKQTSTPIIVFDGDRIQQLTADEYGKMLGRSVALPKENTPKNGEDHS